jgi:putative addiction module component (TIGR02574 family)
MTNAVRELYEKASRLSESDRAELAGLLLETLQQPPDPGVEEAWAQEIARRLAEYRAGRTRTIPWQELRAELHRANR